MRWIIVCAVVAAGFWYLSEMDRGDDRSAYEQKLRSNKSAMSECVRKAEYAASRMASSAASAEADCAQRLGLYREGGKWHHYNDTRH